MKIVIINYGSGNVQSILFALARIGYTASLSSCPEEIWNADKVIIPGVGEAGFAMARLKEQGLDVLIPSLRQPVLGICLGMQLLCRSTEEGNTKGLGIFDLDIVRFPNSVKVPHMGWNTIGGLESCLFEGIGEQDYMYMVHSYYAPLCDHTIATTHYGIPFSAALRSGNFYGVQFHPEKSGPVGERLLINFINL